MLDTILKKYSFLNTNTGLLMLRIGVALIFILSGWMKVAQMHNTVMMFSQMHIPAIMAYLVVIAEIGGGLAILLGIWTRMAAFILSIIMIVAILLSRHNLGAAILPISIVFSTLALLCTGSGAYSITRMCKCKGSCIMCKGKNSCAVTCCCSKSDTKVCGVCTDTCMCAATNEVKTEEVSA